MALEEVGGRVEAVDGGDLHRLGVDATQTDEAELGTGQIQAVSKRDVQHRIDRTQTGQLDGQMVKGVELMFALEIPKTCHRVETTGRSDHDAEGDGDDE